MRSSQPSRPPRLEDVLLKHYFHTILREQLANYPTRLALKYAAYNTPGRVSFKRVIELTSLSKRVTVFEAYSDLVRFTFKHAQDRGFAFVSGSSWLIR